MPTSDLRRLIYALAVCGAATVGELVGGALTRSLALTADGLHSLIHVGALMIAIWGALTAHRRAPGEAGEAAVINALVIVALSVVLAVESVSRFSAPGAVAYGPAMALTAFGLLANLLTILALGGGAPEDLNHRAALFHMLGDAAVAVLALIGLGAGALFRLPWADAAAGLGGAVILAVIGGRLIRQTIGKAAPSVKAASLFATETAPEL
ncbi:MAG: cation diffusion facilitator family transporter [Pseudomonadota bacterium]|nr:cation diffusion facilitator family transporter [Pseudomonadota bacterium]